MNKDGLVYSLETMEEIIQRNGGKKVIGEFTCMTNVDLYWARRQGFDFEVVGGFGFGVSMVYADLIGPAFEQRIQAKKDGNKLLSNFLKLNYNGAFGVTAQNDITDGSSIITLPEPLRDFNVLDDECKGAIAAAKVVDASEYLTGESILLPSGQTYVKKKKFQHVAEYYCAHSPNHIGAAVLSYARHIMNLIMFNYDAEDSLYTDTDSDDVCERVAEDLKRRGVINDSSSAPLGTLKNDHGEGNGTEPRVFLSLFGAKKVKMHVTLNEEGEVRVFNTFKGFNPAIPSGMNPAYAEMVMAHSLVDIGETFTSNPVEVTSWKRDFEVNGGVQIGEHMQHMDIETYIGDCRGTVVRETDFGMVEYFIPHGAVGVIPSYQFHPNPSADYSRDGMISIRKSEVDTIWGGITPYMMRAFVNKYYTEDRKATSEYVPKGIADCDQKEVEAYKEMISVLDKSVV
jgi:hypothetical protein